MRALISSSFFLPFREDDLFEHIVMVTKTWISSYLCDSFYLYPQSSYHFKELRCSAQCLTLLGICQDGLCLFHFQEYKVHRSQSQGQYKLKSQVWGILLHSQVRHIEFFLMGLMEIAVVVHSEVDKELDNFKWYRQQIGNIDIFTRAYYVLC